MTPAVSTAIQRLLGEVQQLQEELEGLRERVKSAEALADADPLVPLRNRRSFVRELERMIAYAERQGHGIALLMLDVDDLKPINDRGGHAAGDVAIQQVAASLIDCTRASDLLGRLGGDEFGVVLMDTDLYGAEEIRARIEFEVSQKTVDLPEGPLALSVSCGVCAFEPGLSLEDAMRQADESMYRSKRARRLS
ncbi:GGDEF domain-containing protein [Rhodospira trueperi]|nr:diguanylate cyclase [Rhodospira trueperi]